MVKLLIVLLIIFFVIIYKLSHDYNKNIKYVLMIIIRFFSLKIIEILVRIVRLFSTNNTINSYNGKKINLNYYDGGTIHEFNNLLGFIFSGKKFIVNKYNNNLPQPSNYTFSYQSLLCPDLSTLRDKYELSQLLNKTDDDFTQIVAIGNWVHSRWVHGTSGRDFFQPAGFNADIILSRAQLGDTFWCHVYSMTFIQVAAALGFQARLVSLTIDGYGSSDMHSVAEAWCNFFNKWVAIDIDFNIWYERDSVPMSVLEIHDAVISNNIDILNVVKGKNRPPDPEFESRIPLLFEYYRYFYIDMRNDWLSNPYFRSHPASSDKATLFWLDRRLPPVLNLFPKTDDCKQLYWKLNWTFMVFQKDGDRCGLNILLYTLTPNFSHYEVIVNDKDKTTLVDDYIFWPLSVGRNSIAVYSVNLSGHCGVKSEISIDVLDE